jgi:hypothetical protein
MAKVARATEPAGIGLVPGAGRAAGLGNQDGEQHAEQAHQQADDGEAAGEHCVVSFNTHENALMQLNRF